MSRDVQCWLIKSEPAVYSIDDLARDEVAPWTGVRNYQARNFMRDSMRVGDRVLFYHSSAACVGVAGLAEVCRAAYPDFTAWDAKSPYFDARSTKAHPVWMMVDVAFRRKFRRLVELAELRSAPELAGMLVLRRGMRLSVQPVERVHYDAIVRMAAAAESARL